MGGEPDQHVGADQLAHLRDRHVLLADVHPVGADLARDERTVVDDQQRAEPLAQRPRGVRDRDELLVGQLLLAQLNDVDAAGDRLAQQLGQRVPSGGPRTSESGPHTRYSRAPARRARRSAPRSPTGIDRAV